MPHTLRTVSALRYVTPLREGGSLPAIIEADDQQLYVLKFRGAGQGTKALIAELLAGEVIRALGLPVPELVLVEVAASLARSEGDPEIQELIAASVGLNLALAYLPSAFAFEPLLTPPPDEVLASALVWADAYLMNVDRTARNPNMLIWNDALWLIDHGAALYIHHTWKDYLAHSRSRFPLVREHVLLPFASMLAEADSQLSARLGPPLMEQLVALIPDVWLTDLAGFASSAAHRAAYLAYLVERLQAPRAFVEEAQHARSQSL
jgi:hypothetical protein